MCIRYLFLGALSFVLSLTAFASVGPQSVIDRWVAQSIFKSALVGVQVSSLSPSNQEYGYDQERLLTPASIYKVVTTATALEILGPDTRFKTTLAYVGVVDTTRLKGSLLVIAGGDPTFCSSRKFSTNDITNPLDRWVSTIKKLGVTHIEGDLLIDETIFEGDVYNPKWLMEDMGNYYAAGAHGLAFEDNSYQLVVNSTHDRIRFSYTDTLLNRMQWVNQLQIGSRNDLYIRRFYYSNQAYLTGTVLANQKRCIAKGDLYHPALFMGWKLKNKLLEQGVRVLGSVRVIDDPHYKSRATVLDIHHSAKLSEIIRVVNFYSDNLYAEMLLRHIGLTKAEGSVDSGISVVKSYWRSKGISLSSAQLWDGSGLSPSNRLKASQIGAILAYMRGQSPHSAVFSASLPLMGRQGTIASLASGTPLAGQARLKSGSMNGVVAYCGYLEAAHQPYVVTIVINNSTASRSVLLAKVVDLLSKLSSY